MRAGLLLFAVALWVGCLGIFIYWFFPREQTVVVTHLVPEQRVKTAQFSFKLGTETAYVDVPMNYEVNKLVHEHRTREPSRDEWLRFVCLSVFASLVFFYCFVVITAFAKHLWAGGALPKAVEIQLAGTITFLLGALGGALAVPPASPPVDWRDSEPAINQDAEFRATPSPSPSLLPAPARNGDSRPQLDPSEKIGPPTYKPPSPSKRAD